MLEIIFFSHKFTTGHFLSMRAHSIYMCRPKSVRELNACTCGFIYVSIELAMHQLALDQSQASEENKLDLDRDTDEFSVLTNAVVITGGCLGAQQWVCTPHVVADMNFVLLDKRSRWLAKAMGLDPKLRKPWRGHDAIAFILEKRDNAIDQQVAVKLHSDDPLADDKASSTTLENITSRRAGELRQQLVHGTGIPDLLMLDVPPLQTHNGGTIDAFTATVVKPGRRGAKLYLRLDAEHLQWLKRLCSAVDLVDGPEEDEDEGCEDFCDIDEPNVKWRKKNGGFQLGCRYKLADGATKEYFVNPFPHKGKLTMSIEGHASNVREAAAHAQQFYNDHNCP